jgi:UPF0755 protein
MKWKHVAVLVLLAVGCLSAFVFYYGFGWSDLASLSFYENLANPSIRIVKVDAGLRKEQVADAVGDELGWNTDQKTQFENAHLALSGTNTSMEGYYFPKTYMVGKNESPDDMSQLMFSEMNDEIKTVTKPKTTKIINEDTALKIASIIQREAAGNGDMRLISGIIWNRLFAGMKLQMDATLQYAKGTPADWWPPVDPADKNIDSPYNTYLYPSLPPTPIANPGIAAISAAYNPQTTSCLYYLHDKNGIIHCSATYAGHLANISKYY